MYLWVVGTEEPTRDPYIYTRVVATLGVQVLRCYLGGVRALLAVRMFSG